MNTRPYESVSIEGGGAKHIITLAGYLYLIKSKLSNNFLVISGHFDVPRWSIIKGILLELSSGPINSTSSASRYSVSPMPK